MRTLALASILLAACNASSTDNSAPAPVTFRYSALDATGSPLLTGRLTLTSVDDSTVTGTWNIAWAPGADTTSPVGPQVGSGTLTGRRVGGTLILELNPGNADNNVGLQAIPHSGGYSGTWQWTAFTGPRAEGRFVASPE